MSADPSAPKTRYSDFTPRQLSRLWAGFILILLASFFAEFAVHLHPHFTVEKWTGFYAWFGFGGCVLIVLLSKLLGYVLKRREGYYARLESRTQGEGESS